MDRSSYMHWTCFSKILKYFLFIKMKIFEIGIYFIYTLLFKKKHRKCIEPVKFTFKKQAKQRAYFRFGEKFNHYEILIYYILKFSSSKMLNKHFQTLLFLISLFGMHIYELRCIFKNISVQISILDKYSFWSIKFA